MDNEEFYDSLDGDISSSSNTSLTNLNFNVKKSFHESKIAPNTNTSLLVIKPPPNSNCSYGSRKSSDSSLSSQFRSKCSLHSNDKNYSKTDHVFTNNISTIVPLYSGETKINNMTKVRKCCSTLSLVGNQNQELYSQKSKDDGAKKDKTSLRKRRTKNRKNERIQVQNVKSKSYLKIFHSRIGYPASPKKPCTTDTNRSTCGDTKRSSISSISTERDEFQDAEDNELETASYYFRAIAEAENYKAPEYEKNCDNVDTNASCFQMASVSEIFSSNRPSKNIKPLRKCVNSKLLPIPVLGGLGPDTARNQDKMELRKKQLSYGRKASYKNRIKLLEINILKNLKSEMEESTSIKNEV
ncbi:hypothetical protein FQR65_LT09707 [Abscondita terminalis]|nr:hypothetical protein FQR65_LT09707 [Abscondita terminalis]